MKKILVCCLILIFVSVVPVSGSPLVFKATKEVKGGETAELGTIDAAKYRQVRISVTLGGGGLQSRRLTKDTAEFQLNSAKRELDRVTGLVEQGVISRADYDRAKAEFDAAQRNFDNARPIISIFAVEAGEEILIMKFDDPEKFRSIIFDSPPSKLIVKVSGKGTYKIFVWASM